MKNALIFTLAIILIGFTGCQWKHLQWKVHKKNTQETHLRVEELDSLGFTNIGIHNYSFDVTNNYRTSSSSPTKYRMVKYKDDIIFEFYHSKPFIKCRLYTELHYKISNPSLFYQIQFNKKDAKGDECETEKDSISFELKNKVAFLIDSVYWTIYKYEALSEKSCNVIYFNDSLGVIKTYSSFLDKGSEFFPNYETNFYDGRKNYIAKAIRENFRGLDNFHTSCGEEPRYINGHIIDF